MARIARLVVFCSAGLLMAPLFAQAKRSRCADCHYADPAAPRRNHLNDWDRSPHGRNNVAERVRLVREQYEGLTVVRELALAQSRVEVVLATLANR